MIPIETYRSDPLAFIADLMIPSAHGLARFGDVMADFQRERFQALCPALLAIARGEKPDIQRHLWEASKGASKDSDLACCLLWLLAFTTIPVSCMIGAADAEQADQLRRAAKAILHLNQWLDGRIEILRDAIVCEATGSRADIVAADTAGGAHGRRDHLTIINELSHIPDARFEAPRTWMNNADKMPWGVVVVAQNAGFVSSEAYRWRQIAFDSAEWSTHIYARPAPWISESSLAQAKRRDPLERFNRLYWGVWSTGTGNALSAEVVEAAVTLKGPHSFRMLDAYLAGLDLSTTRDRSSLVLVGINLPLQRVELAGVWEWTPEQCGGRVVLNDVQAEIERIHRAVGLDGLIADPWQAEKLLEDLAPAGIRTWRWPSTATNLDLMARALLNAFRDRQIALYRHESLLQDLYELNITERDAGYRLQSKRGRRGHQDSAYSLASILPSALNWLDEIPACRSEANETHFVPI